VSSQRVSAERAAAGTSTDATSASFGIGPIVAIASMGRMLVPLSSCHALRITLPVVVSTLQNVAPTSASPDTTASTTPVCE
jgi:hypothetical protein